MTKVVHVRADRHSKKRFVLGWEQTTKQTDGRENARKSSTYMKTVRGEQTKIYKDKRNQTIQALGSVRAERSENPACVSLPLRFHISFRFIIIRTQSLLFVVVVVVVSP